MEVRNLGIQGPKIDNMPLNHRLVVSTCCKYHGVELMHGSLQCKVAVPDLENTYHIKQQLGALQNSTWTARHLDVLDGKSGIHRLLN